jgi:hypothetical protein
MAIAVTIDDAINDLIINLYAPPQPANMNANFVLWLNIFADTLPTSGPPFFPLVETDPNNRFVRNWQFQSRIVLSTLPPDPTATQVDIQRVAELLNRTLNAVKFADINGEITNAQRDAVIDQYNLAFC